MKEEQMLYCLVAFILGWFLSRQMGNGFSIGGSSGYRKPCAAHYCTENYCDPSDHNDPNQKSKGGGFGVKNWGSDNHVCGETYKWCDGYYYNVQNPHKGHWGKCVDKKEWNESGRLGSKRDFKPDFKPGDGSFDEWWSFTKDKYDTYDTDDDNPRPETWG